MPSSDLPGLQAQRTDLSWTRTSLAFLANGALLLLRVGLTTSNLVEQIAVAAAFLLAAFAALMSHRRRRDLTRRPLPVPLAANRSLLWLGLGTFGFGAVVLAVIALD